MKTLTKDKLTIKIEDTNEAMGATAAADAVAYLKEIMKDGKEIGRLVGADFQNTEEVIWQKIKAIIK